MKLAYINGLKSVSPENCLLAAKENFNYIVDKSNNILDNQN